MIQVTRTFTRPNASIPWHDEANPFAPFRDHASNTYFKTNKIVLSQSPTSDDLLSRTWLQIWTSQDYLSEWVNDPYLREYWILRETYNASVGIIAEHHIITTI